MKNENLNLTNYEFKNKDLRKLALSHSSSTTSYLKNNERLEFLGDRILGLVIADVLFQKFPNEKDGDLAKRHSTLVSSETLFDIGIKFGFDKTLKTSKFVEIKNSKKVLADSIEAYIAAIYIDTDFQTIFKIVENSWEETINKMKTVPQDNKSLLQEKTQSVYRQLPEYELIAQSGEEHTPIFTVKVSVKIDGKINSDTGSGKSKKEAEQSAAKKLLKNI